MKSPSALLDDLEKEFCPPLDSSVVAALLNDILPIGEDTIATPQHQLESLREQLSELALHAQLDELQFAEDYPSNGQSVAASEDTSTAPSLSFGCLTTSSGYATELSEISQSPFTSPQAFLQMALPHISPQVINNALVEADRDSMQELDMWELISGILSREAIREMEERGSDSLDDELGISQTSEMPWEMVAKKKNKSSDPGARKKKKAKPIPIVDIRQRQNRPSPSRANTEPARGPSVSDPWIWVSSLSDYISSLLPTSPPEYFKSYFHSPKYTTPYSALISALNSLNKSDSADGQYTPILINILDILLPEYEQLDPEERSRLVSDAELCITATQGCGEDALELVRTLRQLDLESSGLEAGIFHTTLPPNHTPSLFQHQPSSQETRVSRLPDGPPSIPPPPKSRKRSPSSGPRKPNAGQWQKVPQRKATASVSYALAAHIPAYSRDVNGNRVRSTTGEPVSTTNEQLGEYRRRIKFRMQKRDEMLMEASRMWKRGNAKSRGGEVAMYFAEKAREFQEMARQDSLEAARILVDSKRVSSRDPDTIDLHGATTAEALYIVKETLQLLGKDKDGASPLKIITGRGNHSVNQTSVLKPALKKMLEEEGIWIVTSWDAGLVVRRRRQ